MTDADFRRIYQFGAHRMPEDVRKGYLDEEDRRRNLARLVNMIEGNLNDLIQADAMEARASARRIMVRADNALRNEDMQRAREEAKK